MGPRCQVCRAVPRPWQPLISQNRTEATEDIERRCLQQAALRVAAPERSSPVYGRDNINLGSHVVPRPVTRRRARKGGERICPRRKIVLGFKVAGSRAPGMKYRVAPWDRQAFFRPARCTHGCSAIGCTVLSRVYATRRYGGYFAADSA